VPPIGTVWPSCGPVGTAVRIGMFCLVSRPPGEGARKGGQSAKAEGLRVRPPGPAQRDRRLVPRSKCAHREEAISRTGAEVLTTGRRRMLSWLSFLHVTLYTANRP